MQNNIIAVILFDLFFSRLNDSMLRTRLISSPNPIYIFLSRRKISVRKRTFSLPVAFWYSCNSTQLWYAVSAMQIELMRIEKFEYFFIEQFFSILGVQKLFVFYNFHQHYDDFLLSCTVAKTSIPIRVKMPKLHNPQCCRLALHVNFYVLKT